MSSQGERSLKLGAHKGNKTTEMEGIHAKEILCMEFQSPNEVLLKGGEELMGISNI